VFPDQKSKFHVSSYPNTHPDVWIQKISIPTTRMSLEILRGWVVSTAKFLKGKYEAKREIPGERGTNQTITILCGGLDIFWNHTILENNSGHILLKGTYMYLC